MTDTHLDGADVYLLGGTVPWTASMVVTGTKVTVMAFNSLFCLFTLALCARKLCLLKAPSVQMVIFPLLYEVVKDVVTIPFYTLYVADRGYAHIGVAGCQVLGVTMVIGYGLFGTTILVLTMERWRIVRGSPIGRYSIAFWNLAAVGIIAILALGFYFFGTGYHVPPALFSCLPRWQSRQLGDLVLVWIIVGLLTAGSVVVLYIQFRLYFMHAISQARVKSALELFSLLQVRTGGTLEQGMLFFRFHALTVTLMMSWGPYILRIFYEASSGQPIEPWLDYATALMITIGQFLSNVVLALFTPLVRSEVVGTLAALLSRNSDPALPTIASPVQTPARRPSAMQPTDTEYILNIAEEPASSRSSLDTLSAPPLLTRELIPEDDWKLAPLDVEIEYTSTAGSSYETADTALTRVNDFIDKVGGQDKP